MKVVFVSSVLLDGAERSNVEAGQAEHALGTFHRSKEANFPVDGH